MPSMIRAAHIELVEIGIEALRDAPSPIEHIRADEAAGLEPVRLQPLGERRFPGVQKEPAVVPDTVRRRIPSGEDRRVRRQRQRHGGDRALKQDALGRDSVECRCRLRARTVGTETIGAGGIERDQQDRGSRGRWCAALFCPTTHDREQTKHSNESDEDSEP